jgi:DNA polymerase-4
VRQESLFPDLELSTLEAHDALEAGHSAETLLTTLPPAQETSLWRVGDDVTHRDLGHGWVQGAGHGVVTVRFETRASGPGPARTFAADTGDITRANPADSLDWPDYVDALRVEDSAATSAPPVDGVGDG